MESKHGAASSEEALRMIAELESGVESLRVQYEQHFLGLIRRPPTEEHARIRGQLLRLRGSSSRSASIRFRVQALHNRFLSYERMWKRTMREREEGTYHRDLARARLRRKELEAAGGVDAVAAAGGESGRPRVDGSKAGYGLADPSRARGDGAAAGQRASLSDQQMRALYDAYVGAKKRCNEAVDGLSFETMAARVRAQIPTILEKHKASSVEFKVLIRDGKALLKAVPK